MENFCHFVDILSILNIVLLLLLGTKFHYVHVVARYTTVSLRRHFHFLVLCRMIMVLLGPSFFSFQYLLFTLVLNSVSYMNMLQLLSKVQ